MEWLHVNIRSGDPFQYGSKQLTLEHLVVHAEFPFVSGGLIFNRPIRVKALNADGTEESHLILNITRLAQVAIWGLGLLVTYALWRNR